jgi:hypothetical protein
MAPAPRINNKKSKKKDKKDKKAKKSKKSDRDLEDGELSRPATPLDNRARQPMGYDGVPLPAPINPYLPTHLQHQLNQPMPYHHSPPGPHPAYPRGHAPPRPPTSLPAPRPPMDARPANYPPMKPRPMGPRPHGPPMPDLRAYLAAPARPLPGYAGMQSTPPQQAYHGMRAVHVADGSSCRRCRVSPIYSVCDQAGAHSPSFPCGRQRNDQEQAQQVRNGGQAGPQEKKTRLTSPPARSQHGRPFQQGPCVTAGRTNNQRLPRSPQVSAETRATMCHQHCTPKRQPASKISVRAIVSGKIKHQ